MKQKDLQDSAKRAALGKLSGLVGIVCNVCLLYTSIRNRAAICACNEPKFELARNLGEYRDSEPARARSFWRRTSI